MSDYAFPYTVAKCESDGVKEVASLLAEGKIIGVMRGAAEFGPRALGNRSILADPRSPDMKNRINAIVKGREAYRPFAPIISVEKAPEWFENAQSSPYMSFTLKWKTDKLSLVPAVVHQDHTGRLQTLTEHTTPWLKALVDAFEELTHVPILLNTSFNVMGKPIVHTINDALAVLSTTGLDAVLIDNILIKGLR
nr:carbamoyltransferase C-terminal domain-containing protein [Marinomonas sp. UCMA 3892]